jgi:hypothetical protein
MICLANLETRLRSKIPRDYTGRKNLLSRKETGNERNRKEKRLHSSCAAEIEAVSEGHAITSTAASGFIVAIEISQRPASGDSKLWLR